MLINEFILLMRLRRLLKLKMIKNKVVTIGDVEGAEVAKEVIKEGIELYKKEHAK